MSDDDQQILDENDVEDVLNGDATSDDDQITRDAQDTADDDTPAGDPDDVDPSPQSETHPSTDSDIDAHERYDEGL